MQENRQDPNYHQYMLMRHMEEKSRKSRKQIAYVLGGLIIFLIALFLFFSLLLPKIGIKLISVNNEIRMGNQLYHGLLNEIKIDPNASSVLQHFADQLHLSKQYPIKVSVAVSEDVNAYALPGGHIVVNSAILQELKSPEELVALLSHESTHINRRHSLQNILSQLGSGFVIGMITNAGGGAARAIVGNANFLLQMSYSRKLEMQADLEGMRLMEKNLIDPKGMMELMQQLKEVNDDSGMKHLSFLSSHPLTDDRIEMANSYIHSHHFTAQTMDETLVDYWKQIKFLEAKED